MAESEDLRSLLRRASRMAGRHYRAHLAQFELSASQAAALLFLNQRHGSTLRELAEALSADLATASALVDRLMSQDLIKRETDPTDRRRARLLLSDRAIALLEPVADATRRTNAVLVEALGEPRAAELAAVLKELIEGMAEGSVASKRDEGPA